MHKPLVMKSKKCVNKNLDVRHGDLELRACSEYSVVVSECVATGGRGWTSAPGRDSSSTADQRLMTSLHTCIRFRIWCICRVLYHERVKDVGHVCYRGEGSQALVRLSQSPQAAGHERTAREHVSPYKHVCILYADILRLQSKSVLIYASEDGYLNYFNAFNIYASVL